jgi:thioredoxin-related protein
MRPVVNGLDQQYGQQVAFANVDYNSSANKELVSKYRVRGHPTFVILDRAGNVSQTFVGATARADLEAAIKKASGG